MILGTHNSWSYLRPKKWWMRLIAFTARCQDTGIKGQYKLGSRCFDLRMRFKDGKLIVAHGIVEYPTNYPALCKTLKWVNKKGDCYVRVLHECRNKKQYTEESITMFKKYCTLLQETFPNIKFWCGKNLYNWETDFEFPNNPKCTELYASVCKPKLIDDWYPRHYAKKHNQKNIETVKDCDILLIDFINYQ